MKINSKFIKSVFSDKNNSDFVIFDRSSQIPPILLNKVVYISQGKSNVKQTITENMIGFKFGEFSPTKLSPVFKKDKKKKYWKIKT